MPRGVAIPHMFRSIRDAALPTLLALAVAAPALADQLPVLTGDKSKISARITPIGDTDRFGLELFDGDRVKIKVKETGPQFGLLTTLTLFDPAGNPISVPITNNGGRGPSFEFTATQDGVHSVLVAGEPGFDGSEGDYQFISKIKRVKPARATFNDGAGGSISYSVNCANGSLLTLKAKTRKGGLDLDALNKPSGRPEGEFAASLKAKANRRSATLKKFRLTGGQGSYELAGAYDPGSSVKVSAKVVPSNKKVKSTLRDAEPEFDLNFHRFAKAGITGSTFVAFGFDLGEPDGEGGEAPPTFWVGDEQVAAGDLERLSDNVYRFPIPIGLEPGAFYDVVVRNPDGQGAFAPNAFEFVAQPVITGMAPTEAGPAGGQLVRLTGTDFRGGTVAMFDTQIVQPQFVFTDSITVRSPAHAPGQVVLTIRDEHGQVAAAPVDLTVLDIGSNAISSIAPTTIQAIGGETITVTGVDFVADSALTLDGKDLDETLVSPTEMTFVAPAMQAGTYELQVEDQYMQTSILDVEITGLDDESDSSVPAPVTTAGMLDAWRATRILCGDVDGDMNDDLVLLRPAVAFGDSEDRPRIRILLGDGDGGLTDGTSGIPAVTALDDWRARDGVLIDVDDDGDLDIAIITPDELDDGNRSSLRILLNDGDGNFTDDTDNATPGASSWGDTNQGVAIFAVDLDGDNVDDLVITHTESFEETIITQPPPMEPPPDPPQDPTIETFYYAGTRVLLNDGDGEFSRDLDALPDVDEDDPLRFIGNTLVGVDVDNDTDTDLFITRDAPFEDPDTPGTYLRVGFLLRNDTATDVTFVDASATLLPAAGDPEYLQGDRAYFHDTDGDGDDDLVVAGNTKIVSPLTMSVVLTPSLRIFEWDAGAFAAAAGGVLPAADGDDQLQCEDVGFGDLDGDGDDEMVIVSAGAPNAGDRGGRILRQEADDTFIRSSTPFLSPLIADDARGVVIKLVDLDGDGDLDVLIARDTAAESERNLLVFINQRL